MKILVVRMKQDSCNQKKKRKKEISYQIPNSAECSFIIFTYQRGPWVSELIAITNLLGKAEVYLTVLNIKDRGSFPSV